jgi:hypothetical protein
MPEDDKTIIGLTETVEICGKNCSKVKARIDTGAKRSSIDKKLAKKLDLGPVIETRTVKSAHGKSERPLVNCTVELAGKRITALFNIADRSEMKYKVLIGRNTLQKLFLIDTSKE